MKAALVQRLSRAWQPFKTIVYAVGYSGACYVLAMWNYNGWRYYGWLGQEDLAAVSLYTLIGVWVLWSIGVGAIILDGMRKVLHESNHEL